MANFKSKIVRNTMGNSALRGSVYMSIEIDNEELEDAVIEAMEEQGYETPCVEESDCYEDGSSICYMISSDEVADFRNAWKLAKKEVA